MGAAEKIDLSGKDWLTVPEAAFYCGVSEDHFRRKATAYGLVPRNFMGKQLYEKAALYAAIHGAKQWSASPSTGVVSLPTSIGALASNGIESPSVRSALEKLKRYEQRKKRS
jgi:hypothetical protein